MTTRLNPMLRSTLTAIDAHVQAHGFAPTLRDLQSALKLASVSTVAHRLHQLEESNLIERIGGTSRAMRITDTGRAYLAQRRQAAAAPSAPASTREVLLTLPVPPPANRYWRSNRGVVHKSKEAKEYAEQVALLCRAAGVEPFVKPAQLSLSMLWRRTERRGDLDGRIKVVLDALQGYAYENDSQIVELHARVESADIDELVITVRECVT